MKRRSRSKTGVNEVVSDSVVSERSARGALTDAQQQQNVHICTVRMRCGVSLVFESMAKGNRFEFASDSVLDWNDRAGLEYKSRKHRAELGRRIVAAPVTAYHINTSLVVTALAGSKPAQID